MEVLRNAPDRGYNRNIDGIFNHVVDLVSNDSKKSGLHTEEVPYSPTGIILSGENRFRGLLKPILGNFMLG